MQSIIRDYYEELYTNKLGNLDEMYKFQEICNQQRLNWEEIGNLNRPVMSEEMESVIKKHPNTENPRNR